MQIVVCEVVSCSSGVVEMTSLVFVVFCVTPCRIVVGIVVCSVFMFVCCDFVCWHVTVILCSYALLEVLVVRNPLTRFYFVLNEVEYSMYGAWRK